MVNMAKVNKMAEFSIPKSESLYANYILQIRSLEMSWMHLENTLVLETMLTARSLWSYPKRTSSTTYTSPSPIPTKEYFTDNLESGQHWDVVSYKNAGILKSSIFLDFENGKKECCHNSDKMLAAI